MSARIDSGYQQPPAPTYLPINELRELDGTSASEPSIWSLLRDIERLGRCGGTWECGTALRGYCAESALMHAMCTFGDPRAAALSAVQDAYDRECRDVCRAHGHEVRS